MEVRSCLGSTRWVATRAAVFPGAVLDCVPVRVSNFTDAHSSVVQSTHRGSLEDHPGPHSIDGRHTLDRPPSTGGVYVWGRGVGAGGAHPTVWCLLPGPKILGQEGGMLPSSAHCPITCWYILLFSSHSLTLPCVLDGGSRMKHLVVRESR
jgi:hypothetical protein